jgi:hypothetical protein
MLQVFRIRMDPHHFEKLDPDLIKVKSWIRIRIRIKVYSRIRIRIKVKGGSLRVILLDDPNLEKSEW